MTLYLPGVWLKPAPAQNIVKILELQDAPMSPTLSFLDYPILNRTGSLFDSLLFN